ncbi:MAG: lipopolysaccharide heptosyltransferase I [Tepidisphaeraceae bacterium]
MQIANWEKTSPQRVLLIKPSAIGDVVHALPVLNLLRRRWPKAHLAWLITPACAGLLEGHPMIDELILFERRRFGRGWRDPKSVMGLHAFMKNLRRRQFDLVIDLQGLFRSGWMTFRTRAPVRVGFANARELAPIFYTHRIDVGTSEQHAVDRYLRIAAALGCGDARPEFPFYVTDDDRRQVDALVGGTGGIHRYAVLLPGTNWATKRWPVERFQSLVAPLRDRFGLSSVVAGSPDEFDLAAQVSAGVAGGINLAGKTSLRQLVALLERADLVIANDSGPMHIAAALARPMVALFGPTNPVRTGPYRREDTVLRLDLPCSPCYSRVCSHQSCLQWMGIDAVLDLAEKQMRAVD